MSTSTARRKKKSQMSSAQCVPLWQSSPATSSPVCLIISSAHSECTAARSPNQSNQSTRAAASVCPLRSMTFAWYLSSCPHSDNEPDIRRLLHFYTSWSAMEDVQCTFIKEDPPHALWQEKQTLTPRHHSCCYSPCARTGAFESRHLKRGSRRKAVGDLHEPSRGPGRAHVRVSDPSHTSLRVEWCCL